MDMNNPARGVLMFFKEILNPQAYLNLVYSMASFPLGLFYFIFLVTGLALGVSLTIVWIGIPILLFVSLGSLAFGNFERFLVIHLLKENVPALLMPAKDQDDLLSPVKENLTNPVLLKSPLYLFLKFPLGLAAFIILTTLISLTLAFLTLPFTYEHVEIIGPGIFFGADLPDWHINGMGDALIGTLIGLFLWPVTLHISNALAWVQGKFARLMLSSEPMVETNVLPELI
jgi:hypothetical protein